MVSARAKRIMQRAWKASRPGLKNYGKQLAAFADSELARRTAGTSYAGLVPSVSSFIPATEGSGLSLAGRGCKRKSKRRNGEMVPLGFTVRRGKLRDCKTLKRRGPSRKTVRKRHKSLMADLLSQRLIHR